MTTKSHDGKDIADRAAARMLGCADGECLYTFHREGMFYPLALKGDADAIANAKCNPGTLKVVNEITGETVWPQH